mgnify:CR=1 FL=1
MIFNCNTIFSEYFDNLWYIIITDQRDRTIAQLIIIFILHV